MRYLINTVESYRVSSVEEAEALHEELKNDKTFTLVSFGYKYECKKSKGEIEDEWYLATAKKEFNDKKEPVSTVEVKYEVKF